MLATIPPPPQPFSANWRVPAFHGTFHKAGFVLQQFRLVTWETPMRVRIFLCQELEVAQRIFGARQPQTRKSP